jgi:hypothetical protein
MAVYHEAVCTTSAIANHIHPELNLYTNLQITKEAEIHLWKHRLNISCAVTAAPPPKIVAVSPNSIADCGSKPNN